VKRPTQAPTESLELESITEAKPACSNPRKRWVLLSPVQSDHETALPNDHNNSDNDESESQGTTKPQRKLTKPKKKKKKTAHSKSTCYPLPYLWLTRKVDDNVDTDGMHNDVHIQSIDESDDDEDAQTLNKTQATADTKEFFKPVALSEKPVKGNKKRRVKCMPCAYVLYSSFQRYQLMFGICF